MNEVETIERTRRFVVRLQKEMEDYGDIPHEWVSSLHLYPMNEGGVDGGDNREINNLFATIANALTAFEEDDYEQRHEEDSET